MTMHEVSDSYDLMQRLGMSAEASVKTIGFEASGKASFARDRHVSRFASNFVMNASVENGVRYAAPAAGSLSWKSSGARRSCVASRGGDLLHLPLRRLLALVTLPPSLLGQQRGYCR